MMRARFENAIPAALTLGFALSLPISAAAQSTSGAGLSSGSGQGTGSGSSSAIQRNDSNSVSGVGPGTPVGGRGGRVGPERGGLTPATGNSTGTMTSPMPSNRSDQGVGRNGTMPAGPSGFSVPMGPGVDVSFPDDTSLFPFTPSTGEAGLPGQPAGTTVSPKELDFARSISDPGDRCLTLQRVANVAIFSNQLDLAHRALSEAASAATQVTDPVVHDLRLIALVTALNNLSEAHLREGKTDLSISELQDVPNANDTAPLPKPPSIDRPTLIRRADHEWRRAAYLAGRIGNPTYRSEMLFRVVDSQSFGSQTIINEFPRGDSSRHGTAEAQPPDSLAKPADSLLVGASRIAQQIERPVWRDRALVTIATAAAQSKQFARGLQVARLIPQPEVRTDALVKIAESQARPAGNDPTGATATYQEAARAVASIPLDDPRAVLAGVLIDNLISVGRFEDARRMIVLYPDTSRRLIALGAIAESQGFRGASESAVQWILREVPEQHRPFLYRRLRFGMLAAIEQNRSRDLSNRDR